MQFADWQLSKRAQKELLELLLKEIGYPLNVLIKSKKLSLITSRKFFLEGWALFEIQVQY
jgi:hypothetical protein